MEETRANMTDYQHADKLAVHAFGKL
eukprot:SAG31_NODE_34244_length_335_cov_0.661017_1_plen_25_part_01